MAPVRSSAVWLLIPVFVAHATFSFATESDDGKAQQAFGDWLRKGDATMMSPKFVPRFMPKKFNLGETHKAPAQCKDHYKNCPLLKKKYGCSACCLKEKSVAQACPSTCDPCEAKWTTKIAKLEQENKEQLRQLHEQSLSISNLQQTLKGKLAQAPSKQSLDTPPPWWTTPPSWWTEKQATTQQMKPAQRSVLEEKLRASSAAGKVADNSNRALHKQIDSMRTAAAAKQKTANAKMAKQEREVKEQTELHAKCTRDVVKVDKKMKKTLEEVKKHHSTIFADCSKRADKRGVEAQEHRGKYVKCTNQLVQQAEKCADCVAKTKQADKEKQKPQQAEKEKHKPTLAGVVPIQGNVASPQLDVGRQGTIQKDSTSKLIGSLAKIPFQSRQPRISWMRTVPPALQHSHLLAKRAGPPRRRTARRSACQQE